MFFCLCPCSFVVNPTMAMYGPTNFEKEIFSFSYLLLILDWTSSIEKKIAFLIYKTIFSHWMSSALRREVSASPFLVQRTRLNHNRLGIDRSSLWLKRQKMLMSILSYPVSFSCVTTSYFRFKVNIKEIKNVQSFFFLKVDFYSSADLQIKKFIVFLVPEILFLNNYYFIIFYLRFFFILREIPKNSSQQNKK